MSFLTDDLLNERCATRPKSVMAHLIAKQLYIANSGSYCMSTIQHTTFKLTDESHSYTTVALWPLLYIVHLINSMHGCKTTYASVKLIQVLTLIHVGIYIAYKLYVAPPKMIKLTDVNTQNFDYLLKRYKVLQHEVKFIQRHIT